MDGPFLKAFHTVGQIGAIGLLPSPYATLLIQAGTVRLYGPHTTVWAVSVSKADILLFLSPNFIKDIVGHTRYFINKTYTDTELPLLSPFRDCKDRAMCLDVLNDARQAVKRTHDEEQFEKLFTALLSKEKFPAGDTTLQRQAERLCLRYAGQSPLMILRQQRLTKQLAKDISAKKYTLTAQFSDQSHYIRECKQLTGRTPQYWQKMSVTFYSYNGEIVMLEA